MTFTITRGNAHPSVQPFFQGEARQKDYLKQFTDMNPEAGEALRKIYHAAREGREPPSKHVVETMKLAHHFPELFNLALQNIRIRLALRFVSEEKAVHLREVLEDFHTALDAFFNGISLDEASEKRKAKGGLSGRRKSGERPEKTVQPEDMPDIADFKKQAAPQLEKARRVLRNKNTNSNNSQS